MAVALVAGLLEEGRITAIDRSPTAIERARARNGASIDAGRVELHLVELAGLDPEATSFDKAFAVDVNVFAPELSRHPSEPLVCVTGRLAV